MTDITRILTLPMTFDLLFDNDIIIILIIIIIIIIIINKLYSLKIKVYILSFIKKNTQEIYKR